MKRFIAAACVVIGLTLSVAAAAQELRVAVGAEPTSIDPLFHNLNPNLAIARHIFDQLAAQDEKQRLQPALALSWQPLDDTTWEFKLRADVRFHDGTPLSPEDIIFSIDRADKVPNSPSALSIYTKSIKEITVVDKLTIRIKTAEHYPLLVEDLSNIAIQSKKAADGKTTDDFNKGVATNGTGPFKFVEWVPGNRIVFARNDNYWGKKPYWKTVTIRPITSAASRLAALLAGDVDFIEEVPTTDIKGLKENPKVTLEKAV